MFSSEEVLSLLDFNDKMVLSFKPLTLLFVFMALIDLVSAPDTSGCLLSWKVASYTKNGVTQTNVEACYVYGAVTWLNVALFWIMWIAVIKILMSSMHS